MDWQSYIFKLSNAMQRVEKVTPKTDLAIDTPIGQWCQCRRVVRTAVEAMILRERGELVDEEGWIAIRKVISGLLPECQALVGASEQDRQQKEQKVATAIVELQQVVINMLHVYREGTRRAQAQKREQIDVWWVEQVRKRALHAKVVKGLKARAAGVRIRRKRLLGVVDDAMERAHVRERESKRRAVAREGGEVALTRTGGLHRVGMYTENKKRGACNGWEAGDYKMTRTDTDSSKNRMCVSDSGKRGGPGIPAPPPPPLPLPLHTTGDIVTRRHTVTSRWHPHALQCFIAPATLINPPLPRPPVGCHRAGHEARVARIVAA